MSFEMVCDSCGASSGPSIGVCPYCKSVMSEGGQKKSDSPVYAKLVELYKVGDLETALIYVHEIMKNPEKYDEDPALLFLSAKILIETEGPTGRIRGLLGKVLLSQPDNKDASDYLDIVQARFEFSSNNMERGDELLERVLNRCPENPHALFAMGTHLFWHMRDHHRAIPYLEKCVRVRPKFLRAWACLAAIAKDLDNPQLAATAIHKCLAMESNGTMKKFFQELLGQLSEKKAA